MAASVCQVPGVPAELQTGSAIDRTSNASTKATRAPVPNLFAVVAILTTAAPGCVSLSAWPYSRTSITRTASSRSVA